MSYPVRIIISLAAPIADGIAQSQTLSGGGVQNVTLNGSLVVNGVAVLDVARRVAITSVGNDSGITFTINGTNYSGITQSENVTGANAGTIVSKKDFLTVTSIISSGNTAAAITVGTNGQASTPWIMTDHYKKHRTQSGMAVYLTPGSVLNYTVEDTHQDLQDLTYYTDPNKHIQSIPNASPDLSNATTNGEGGYIAGTIGVRLTLNSYTSGAAEFILA